MSLELTLNEHQINLGFAKSHDRLIYEFHNYRLDADHLMLYRNDEEISLTPKQVETLLALIEKNGEIVSKDVMMTRLWGDTAVEESNLIQNIHHLRRELGDAPNGKPMIETLRRRGYRFNADLRISRNGIVSSGKTSIVEIDMQPWYRRRPVALALAMAGLLGLVIVASSFLLNSLLTPAVGRTQFAVLPLKPNDSASRSEILEVGYADFLIDRLNSINGLAARPLSATLKFDALDQDPLAAGRELHVDHVIDSSYQIADGRFRLTARLINVSSGQIEDVYEVDADAGSVLAIQDAVSSKVGNRIIARFGRATAPTTKRGTNNEEAYRLYLQGRNLTMKRSGGAGKKAIEYFEQAIKIDPNYALAYARMAHASWGVAIADKSMDAEKAKGFVRKALELDPNLAEAYATRGYIGLAHDWDFAAAERDLRRAIELEPNNDTAHWLYGLLLTNRGNFDEGLRELEAAIAIDPAAVLYLSHRGRILYYARRYDEAITQYQHAIDLDDRFQSTYSWMVRVYEIIGDHETAYRFFLKQEERSPRKDQLDRYPKVYETSGLFGVRQVAETNGRLFDLARLHSLRGEKDEAFENLNKAVEERHWMMTTLNVEPAFDSLRDDPRFAELLSRVGLK